MISFIVALLVQTQSVPEQASFDYSGIPVVTAGDPSQVQWRSHSATLDVTLKDVRLTTVTEIKNLTSSTITVTVLVPRRREGDETSGAPGFPISAQVGNVVLNLRPAAAKGLSRHESGHHVHYESDLTATFKIQPNATAGLRTSCTVPLGYAAYERKMRATGYALAGNQKIDQFVISYRTGPRVVFHLPLPHPALAWQVGTSGAFTKETGFVPGDRISWLTFYPGGFAN